MSSRRNEIGTTCEKLKNSKNFQDQNEKHLGLIFWQERKITKALWEAESTVHLPPRDMNLLNQDVPGVHFKNYLETKPKLVSKLNQTFQFPTYAYHQSQRMVWKQDSCLLNETFLNPRSKRCQINLSGSHKNGNCNHLGMSNILLSSPFWKEFKKII